MTRFTWRSLMPRNSAVPLRLSQKDPPVSLQKPNMRA